MSDSREKTYISRVRTQNPEDGMQSVYFMRGKFGSGTFQNSEMDSLDMNNIRQSINTDNTAQCNTTFRGAMYSSLFHAGLISADSGSDTPPLPLPATEVHSSEIKACYWKSGGLDSTYTDDYYNTVNTSNAVLSDSVWGCGVWEGGILRNTVWMSGSERSISNSIFGETYSILPSSEAGFNLPSKYPVPANYNFGGGVDSLQENYTKDMIPTLVNNTIRYAGSVDNLASVFVNGEIQGSVWNGGTFMRGMVRSSDINAGEDDFFGSPAPEDTFTPTVWARGIWLSGYFSYFSELDTLNSVTDQNQHLADNKRCLFMGISASICDNTVTTLGISEAGYSDYINNVGDSTSVHNASSLFSRKIWKRNISSGDTDFAYTSFSGHFVNGILYENYIIGDNNILFNINSSIGGWFMSMDDPSPDYVIKDISDYPLLFDSSFRVSDSVSLGIPLSAPVMTYRITAWTPIFKVNIPYYMNGGNVDDKADVLQNLYTRHNSSTKFGDSTDINNLNPVPLTGDKVSFYQGSGSVWHPDEPWGEPKE